MEPMADQGPVAGGGPDGVRTLGIVGAGLMGGGIAEVAILRGLEVRLFDAADGAAGRAVDALASRIEHRVERGKVTPDEAQAALARVQVAGAIEEAAAADAVIEAVIEQLDVKRDLFRALDDAAAPDALLATNTSSLPVTAIAADAARPERIIGMHFFSPVPAMRLCEIVRGLRTSDATAERARQLAGALGKDTITVARDDAGFVTSRLMTVLIQEAVRILESGLATPEDIDRACTLGFGHAMGPLRTADLTGVDVSMRANQAIFEQTGDPRYAVPQTLRRLVAAGDLGRKSGRGFYDYADGDGR